LPRSPQLTPPDLADLGEAALKLGLAEHGQWMVDAAFDAFDGIPPGNLDDVIADISRVARTDWRKALLSPRQKQLLRLAALAVPLVLLCVAHCRQATYYPGAICSHTVALLER